MLTVAALVDSASALGALRRSYPDGQGRIRGCRTAAALTRLIEAEPVDVVVVGTRARGSLDWDWFRTRFPTVPVVIYGAVRPDQGPSLLALDPGRIRALLVEGIDDPVVGDVVSRYGYLATRRAGLAELPRLLRLTEPLQKRAFDLLVGSIGRPPTTASLARKLRVSREHLSRQFAAAGAPNLKRVMDLLRLLVARDWLANPGRPVAVTAELLGYSSPSHFRSTVRRLFRCDVAELQRASLQDLIRRFLGAGNRSRAR